MKKKLVGLSIFLLIFLLIFYYVHPINLQQKAPYNDYSKLVIYYVGENKSITIDEKEKVKSIYEFVIDHKVKRMAKWFYTGLSGSPVYYLIFTSNNNVLYVTLIGNSYIKINQTRGNEHDYAFLEGDFNPNQFLNIIQ